MSDKRSIFTCTLDNNDNNKTVSLIQFTVFLLFSYTYSMKKLLHVIMNLFFHWKKTESCPLQFYYVLFMTVHQPRIKTKNNALKGGMSLITLKRKNKESKYQHVLLTTHFQKLYKEAKLCF